MTSHSNFCIVLSPAIHPPRQITTLWKVRPLHWHPWSIRTQRDVSPTPRTNPTTRSGQSHWPQRPGRRAQTVGAKMDDSQEGEWRQNKYGSSVNCNYVQVYWNKSSPKQIMNRNKLWCELVVNNVPFPSKTWRSQQWQLHTHRTGIHI